MIQDQTCAPEPGTASRIRFTNREASAFVAELKAGVADWFAATGKSDKANFAMVARTIILLGTLFGAYLLLITNALPPSYNWWLVILLGVCMAGIGFGVAHDALHGAYARTPWINTALGASFDLLGANGYMWQITHNVIHHTYTNIHGIDEDLTVSPLLRLTPEADRFWFHRFQTWYALAAYSMSTLFWVFVKDFKYFLKKDLGPFQNRHHSTGAITWLVASKVAYFVYALVLPLIFIHQPWWLILLGFVAVHLTAGMILGVVFQLAHVVEGIDYPTADVDGSMEHAWAVHEMVTTSNFAPRNWLLRWYVGGLNYQIEHHLLPRVCSIHYPKLSPLVRRLAAQHGIPYNEHPTLRAAVRSHWRMLHSLGRAPV